MTARRRVLTGAALAAYTAGALLLHHGGAHQAHWPMVPDPRLTPGATLNVTVDELCVVGYTKTVRNVPSSVAQQAFAEYHVDFATKGAGELDHLISLELGGSNELANLWPELGKRPNVKDAVEGRLHREVCAGTITLKRAQQIIVDPTQWG